MEKTPLKLAFGGDVYFSEEIARSYESVGSGSLYPLRDIEGLLRHIDFGMINLEGPTHRGVDRRPEVAQHLANDPQILKFCRQNNLKVLSLANNHILDFGSEGLAVTLKAIAQSGLYAVGAGENIQDASQPTVVRCRGRKAAFFAFTSAARNVGSIIADVDAPGCAPFTVGTRKLTDRIKAIRSRVDMICISAHWGREYFRYPEEQQVGTAHDLVDAGADYVICHHPHIQQGIELYHGSLIAYSLGNLFFSPFHLANGRPVYQKKVSREFMIVTSNFHGPGNLQFELFGGKMDRRHRLILYKRQKLNAFRSRIYHLAQPFQVEAYGRFYEKYSVRREKEMLRENLLEVFKKMRLLSIGELVRTVKLSDLKRNIGRLAALISR